MKKFRFLEHTADVKFQAFGKSIEDLFKNSALALKEIITKDKVRKKALEEFSIQIEGEDLEGGLQSFLENLLFLFETKFFIWKKLKSVDIKKNEKGYEFYFEVVGQKLENQKIEAHIKAITYNEMFVKKEGKNWVAQVVVDV